MSYNRNFKNIVSQPGRYNTPEQFVSASPNQPQGTPGRNTRSTAAALNSAFSDMVSSGSDMMQNQDYMDDQYDTNVSTEPKIESMESAEENGGITGEAPKPKPAWMKSGVKKISNKERRRRQNNHLRKLLTPKNALMVLNEIVSNQGQQPISSICQVKQNENTFFGSKLPSFCTEFNVNGKIYRGVGETKNMARNSAAEQAIRDLVVNKMTSVTQEANMNSNNEDNQPDEEPLPMIQLASYALHKLFTEWRCEGLTDNFSPAQLVSGMVSASPPKPPKAPTAPKPPKPLPADAGSMHPCMLLCQMRQGLSYNELGVEGDKPQNMMYTMGVTVDGTTYIGKASSKKEARRQAARSACQHVFKIQYPDE